MRSKLYAAGTTQARCSISTVTTARWRLILRYLNSFADCLDRLWSREFERANLYFSPPHRAFVRHRVNDRVCGKMPVDDAVGTYCDGTHTFYVLISTSGFDVWTTAWSAVVTAHEYGHHVQYMANILDYERVRPDVIIVADPVAARRAADPDTRS